jgi:hypothetical protein
MLQGEKDILTGLVRADEEIYASARCPRCNGLTVKEVDAVQAIRSGAQRPIPTYCCRCLECGCLFSPFSDVILEMGNLGRLAPLVPLIQPED